MDNPGTRTNPTDHFTQYLVLRVQGWYMDNPGTRTNPTDHFTQHLEYKDGTWIILILGMIRQTVLQST